MVLFAAPMAACNFCADFSPIRSSVSIRAGVRSNRSAGVLHPVALHQLIDELVAEPLNIERAARGEVLDLLLALRRAAPAAGAARDGLIGFTHHRRAAHRTALRQLDERRARDPPLRQHPHHLGNHVPGAADHHGVARPHVLARHLIHVVQGRVADGDTAHEHRLEPGHRRQRTGAPHLKFDAAHAW